MSKLARLAPALSMQNFCESLKFKRPASGKYCKQPLSIFKYGSEQVPSATAEKSKQKKLQGATEIYALVHLAQKPWAIQAKLHRLKGRANCKIRTGSSSIFAWITGNFLPRGSFT
jgi:hypothetical protein